jgi:hypothetical protein
VAGSPPSPQLPRLRTQAYGLPWASTAKGRWSPGNRKETGLASTSPASFGFGIKPIYHATDSNRRSLAIAEPWYEVDAGWRRTVDRIELLGQRLRNVRHQAVECHLDAAVPEH